MRNLTPLLAAAAVISACASAPIAGIDKVAYTPFACEGKGFSARLEEDGSVRLRTHEGSVNVALAGEGVYQGDGWTLANGSDGTTLKHKDKVVGKNCRKE